MASTGGRSLGELLKAWYAGPWPGWVVVLGDIGQTVALGFYFWTMWTRIRPVASHLREAKSERF